MNWKNTWILVGLAAALFAFIFLFERRLKTTDAVEQVQPVFAKLKPTASTSITLRRGNQFTLTLERTNDDWRFVKPFAYPAANFAVQNFLETLERVIPSTHITPREILSRKADFGFDSPLIVISLERFGERAQQVRFGARTAGNDQVYVEIVGQPGVYVVSAELLDRMPATPHDWRSTALFHFGEEKPDRVEITRGGAAFALQLDPANKLWRLTRPSHRADQYQVQQLISKILAARVVEFVADDAPPDGEAFGLQTPESEVTLGSGLVERKVQFGRSPAGDPGRVYARILSHSNIVLVPKSAVEMLPTSYTDLRDRQLVAFAPEFVDTVEVRGEENFIVRKEGDGWKAGDGQADPAFVAEWLTLLSQMEIKDFVKDIVTDFAPFGLSPAPLTYTLRTTITNAAGPTNLALAQLAFGTKAGDERFFARRFDEDSVYAIGAREYSHLPGAAWQFHDHRIWNFTTNQVARITVRQGETTREVVRQPNGDWIASKGWVGEVNPLAAEETTWRLGQLRADMWLGRGESAKEKFGFGANSAQVTVELRGEKPQSLTVEFGERVSPLQLPYALTTVDGQPTVFEFPWQLYGDLQRYLQLPAPPRRPRQ
jgi:hypothetical protein